MRTGQIVAGIVLMVCVAAAPMPRAAGRSDLADAAARHDTAAVRKLLQQKAEVNGTGVDGSTAIHWAVYHDDLAMVDLLIKAGADVKAATREGVTPLSMATLYGGVPLIDRLLKAGADAKARGPNGETMVMYAARNGNPAAIKLLVAAGADVNAKEDGRGTTALMWAAEQHHAQAVRMLLELGADHAAKSGPAGLPRNYMANRVNTRAVEAAQRRRTAAAAAGRTYEEQLAWEAANNVDLGGAARGFNQGLAPGEAAAPRGRGQGPGAGPGTPAAAATPPVTPPTTPPVTPPATPATPPPPAGAAGRGAARGAGVAIAAADNDTDGPEVAVAGLVGSGGGGLTALTFAAREGDLESAKALIEAGADVNQTTQYGWTPLLTATNNRNYKLGAYLIEHGANVSLANKGGWTPLYLATDNRNIEGGDYPVPKADMDHLEFITLLLEKGANANAAVKDNTLTRTIFTMQWFLEDGATPFVRAAQSSDTALMTLLLKHGADPKRPTGHGDTALTAAAGIGWVEGVTYERSVKDNLDAVRMLLDLGLDPNAANRDGRTALMGAAMKGRSDVVQLLVDRGARLDQHDKGSRDTDTVVSVAAGATWIPLDYADGLVRTGVQSAVARPDTSALIRKLMVDRNLPVPPANRNITSICVVSICQGVQ